MWFLFCSGLFLFFSKCNKRKIFSVGFLNAGKKMGIYTVGYKVSHGNLGRLINDRSLIKEGFK